MIFIVTVNEIKAQLVVSKPIGIIYIHFLFVNGDVVNVIAWYSVETVDNKMSLSMVSVIGEVYVLFIGNYCLVP